MPLGEVVNTYETYYKRKVSPGAVPVTGSRLKGTYQQDRMEKLWAVLGGWEVSLYHLYAWRCIHAVNEVTIAHPRINRGEVRDGQPECHIWHYHKKCRMTSCVKKDLWRHLSVQGNVKGKIPKLAPYQANQSKIPV